MNISHELFGLWAVHSGLVLAKTLVMSLWTAKRRFANNTFANPEDIVGQPAAKVDYANAEVERVRRCHLVIFTILVYILMLFVYKNSAKIYKQTNLVHTILMIQNVYVYCDLRM